jgi:hypothetical protein
MMEFLIENTADPNRISFLVTGVYKFRVAREDAIAFKNAAVTHLRRCAGSRSPRRAKIGRRRPAQGHPDGSVLRAR